MLANKFKAMLGRNRPHFTLQTVGATREVTLTQGAPLVSIIGGKRSGKSVLALVLAEQLLAQGFCTSWYSRGRLMPGDEGYMESKASRMVLHLESNYRDTFHIQTTDQVNIDEVLYLPKRQLVVIDDMLLLEERRDTSQRLIQWANQSDSVVLLLATAPEDFYRIGLTDKHTNGVSLMLMGRLEISDHSTLPEPLQNHLTRIRFVHDKYAEYLAISPNRNWSEVVNIDLPEGI